MGMRQASMPPLRLVMVVFAIAALAACTPRSVDGQTQVVDGLRLDYGLVALKTSEPPSSHPDSKMHGGPPTQPNGYHVVLSVTEAATGRRVTDAEVSMGISGPGHPGSTAVVRMEPMTVAGEQTWARYVVLPKNGTYRLRFHVRRPGQHWPLKANFRLQRAS